MKRETQATLPEPLIRLDGVVLRYPVGPFIKGSLKTGLFSLFGHRGAQGPQKQFHTALNGVSLSIGVGEKVGIIGRNGAGKSTLLRAMAGIYPVADGRIEVRGRIQSLFDFGLGFETESTGRENIFYRGLAMGCAPDDIAAREKDIVDFAGLGEFIDMPMRMYSAGMYVRLAFAISTYLEGNILLIDEVFGAGDAAFQQRAAERMQGLISRASIVVFVTHDMNLIRRICNRIIWIDGGKLRADGDPDTVCGAYHEEMTGKKLSAA
ncbi:MAG: ATP-binding cassette domain-containing protein [Alphaproteobacteria bacterium]|nr:ATP-binding cassette domain-containing protein [Alphaproteobacteria bacterium]